MKQLKLNLLYYPTNNFSRFMPRDKEVNPWGAFNSERGTNIYNRIFAEPISEPDLYYFTYQYKLLDLMRPFSNLHDGLFISQKCLDIFQAELNLPPHKIYPIFYKKKNKIVSDYYYIYFYFGFRESIIFEKSYFMVDDPRADGIGFFEKAIIQRDVQFEDLNNFHSREFEEFYDKYLDLDYQKVVFPKNSVSTYDIFPVYLIVGSDFYLSDKFVEIFEREKMTGLTTRPADCFWEEE